MSARRCCPNWRADVGSPRHDLVSRTEYPQVAGMWSSLLRNLCPLSRRPALTEGQTSMTEGQTPVKSTRTRAAKKSPGPRAAGRGQTRHGGGAENRTPVQSRSLTGVYRLSCRLGLGRRTSGNPRLPPQPVQPLRAAYRPRPHAHPPRMTPPRERGRSPV